MVRPPNSTTVFSVTWEMRSVAPAVLISECRHSNLAKRYNFPIVNSTRTSSQGNTSQDMSEKQNLAKLINKLLQKLSNDKSIEIKFAF